MKNTIKKRIEVLQKEQQQLITLVNQESMKINILKGHIAEAMFLLSEIEKQENEQAEKVEVEEIAA